jgi:hypothetical protein
MDNSPINNMNIIKISKGKNGKNTSQQCNSNWSQKEMDPMNLTFTNNSTYNIKERNRGPQQQRNLY